METEAICFKNPEETAESLSERLRQILSQNNINDVYKMENSVRGEVFILNISECQNKKNPRPGSQNDVVKLTEIWTKLGHKVHTFINLTKTEFESEFLKFTNNRDFLGDCCTIIIMCHGEIDEKSLENVQLKMYDEHHVSSNWVFEMLSSKNAIFLATKPKLVIFNTCRGTKKDMGEFIMKPISRFAQIETLPSLLPKAEWVPNYANILIVYPCSPGCVTLRDVQEGSVFIQTFISILYAHAKTLDIQTILQNVGSVLIKLAETNPIWGHQSVCTKSVGFNKKLYLNPPSDFGQ